MPVGQGVFRLLEIPELNGVVEQLGFFDEALGFRGAGFQGLGFRHLVFKALGA